jgi:hypothetical protein
MVADSIGSLVDSSLPAHDGFISSSHSLQLIQDSIAFMLLSLVRKRPVPSKGGWERDGLLSHAIPYSFLSRTLQLIHTSFGDTLCTD